MPNPDPAPARPPAAAPPVDRAPRPFRCGSCSHRVGTLEMDGPWRVLHIVAGEVDVVIHRGRVRCGHCRKRIYYAAEKVEFRPKKC